ncbi:MAG: large conductance mechanosensitive channel protein MscL [Hyphomicrobiales bacterium]|nr:large conductance mechanosensitive channel protein MscL [Hyphomicrobiales bacterium]
MLEDFKKFAMRGNVIDLAVGVIIGAAFSKIVSSLVDDVIMPVIGAITGGLDFSNYYLPLSSAIQGHPAYADAKKAGAVLGYGSFLTAVINFLIIAFVLFIAIQQIQKLDRKKAAEPEAPPAPPRSEVLLEQIRDALVKK